MKLVNWTGPLTEPPPLRFGDWSSYSVWKDGRIVATIDAHEWYPNLLRLLYPEK